jgi:hypothetical protein
MNLPIRSIRHVILPAHEVRESGGVTGFLSSQSRKGDWTMPRRLRVACVCGNVELDLREARIPAGESTIEIFVLFGNVEIMFPPGVRVDASGDGFLGNFEFETDPSVPVPPDAPVIRVQGDAYFSNVEGCVRYPGESTREFKRRLKASR